MPACSATYIEHVCTYLCTTCKPIYVSVRYIYTYTGQVCGCDTLATLVEGVSRRHGRVAGVRPWMVLRSDGGVTAPSVAWQPVPRFRGVRPGTPAARVWVTPAPGRTPASLSAWRSAPRARAVPWCRPGVWCSRDARTSPGTGRPLDGRTNLAVRHPTYASLAEYDHNGCCGMGWACSSWVATYEASETREGLVGEDEPHSYPPQGSRSSFSGFIRTSAKVNRASICSPLLCMW